MGGVANAINIIDGFHGLAAGSLMIMLATFAYVAHQVGDDLVFALAMLYAALILGFFLVNFPLGKIFLGDGGAYFGGFLLAALGVLLPARNPEVSAWTAILICAYPVIETLASMRRKARRNGHSVGQPDRVHFHMLAHRRYARRSSRRAGTSHLRNPATSVVTWALPLLTAVFAALAYDSALASAFFFFVTVAVYGQLYRVMSLNAPNLPLGLAAAALSRIAAHAAASFRRCASDDLLSPPRNVHIQPIGQVNKHATSAVSGPSTSGSSWMATAAGPRRAA